MRLVYTLTAYPPSTGGAQLLQHRIACNLADRHKIQAVCFWDKNRTDWLLGTTLNAPTDSCDYIQDGIPVHQIGLSLREKTMLAPLVALYYPVMDVALPLVSKMIQPHLAAFAEKADLIHNVRIGREGLSVASYKMARERDIPFVLTPVHHPRWSSGWRYRAYNKLYKAADRVLALTNAEKQILLSIGVDESKIAVTGMGPILAEKANPEGFLKKYDINGPVILFLGQHYSYKGYRQLLDATRLVWKKEPDAQFVFIGPAVENSEADFVNHADLRIHRLGQVDLQEKTDALAACTLLCLPSTQESFGGVYTEAWSFGKPVIGCNIPAVAEVIEDGVNGFLVEQDAAQIADRILQLLRRPTLASQLGTTGQAKVNARYTWAALASLTEQAYQEVLNS
jgi:glycosyltransferase involved in cell wall biosynthesis